MVFSSSKISAETIQLEPAFQEVILNDEQFVSGSIQIHNTSDIPQSFEVFALDIRQQDEKGQIAFIDKPLSGTAFTLASFIEFTEPVVVLNPQEKKEVSFRIRNSVDLSPGGHYGAVIARVQNSTEDPSEQKILPAISSLLLIRKQGGEQYQLSLAPLELARKSVVSQFPNQMTLLFSNQGNVHVIPHGIIQVKDMFGRLVYKGIVNESSFFVLPQAEREVKVNLMPVTMALPISLFSVEIQGTSEPGDSDFYQSFSVIGINTIALVMLCMILVVLLYCAKRYRASHRKEFHKIV